MIRADVSGAPPLLGSTGSTTIVLAALLVVVGIAMICTAVWLVRATRDGQPLAGSARGDGRPLVAAPRRRSPIADARGGPPEGAPPPAPMLAARPRRPAAHDVAAGAADEPVEPVEPAAPAEAAAEADAAATDSAPTEVEATPDEVADDDSGDDARVDEPQPAERRPRQHARRRGAVVGLIDPHRLAELARPRRSGSCSVDPPPAADHARVMGGSHTGSLAPTRGSRWALPAATVAEPRRDVVGGRTTVWCPRTSAEPGMIRPDVAGALRPPRSMERPRSARTRSSRAAHWHRPMI